MRLPGGLTLKNFKTKVESPGKPAMMQAGTAGRRGEKNVV
jgi:hypothetical protein